ncbi:MAG: histone deacetylase [Desulfobacterales bacterium]|nr:histone deacetylase [Desulfobacterales bacterium]
MDNAFCAVRPPGHHAEVSRAMGFCYFNNVAVAARYIQKQFGLARVGIVDFDVHHGNGTQHIFEDDPTVYYYSIHQHPSFAYPGTGARVRIRPRRRATGSRKTRRCCRGRATRTTGGFWSATCSRPSRSYKPEAIIVSAGFDGHRDDDMSDTKLSTEFYTWMMQQIVGYGQHLFQRPPGIRAGGRILPAADCRSWPAIMWRSC